MATTLSSAISPSDVKVPVASTTGLVAGDWIQIDSEKLRITSVESTRVLCTRGVGSTSPAAHSSGATVTEISADSASSSSAFVGGKFTASAVQSIPAATDTAVILNDADTFDSDGFHDPATENTKITIPSGLDGFYEAFACVEWASNTSGERHLWFRLNGTTMLERELRTDVAAVTEDMHVHSFQNLVAGDYLEFMVRQSSGGALNVVVTLPTRYYVLIRRLSDTAA